MFGKSGKLTDKDKDKLWLDYSKTKSIDLRNKIIEEYAVLVKIIANKMVAYLGTNVDFDELCGFGILGLIDAIDKFDVNASVKFETYASLRIRGEMLDNIRKMDWIPRSLRDKQKKITQAKANCREKGITYPKEDDIAKELGVSVDEYLSWETQLLGANVFSIEGSMTGDSDHDSASPINIVEQTVYELPEEHIDKEELVKVLKSAMADLTEKEKLTITLYYYEELNLKEIAQVLEVSESRVSQIHTKALYKMRDKMGKYMGILLST